MGLVIEGAHLLRRGQLIAAPLRIEGGVIVGLDGARSGDRVLDARGCVVAPAFVDLHTHLRWPGSSSVDTPEDIAHAALAGGFTTVVAMANTDPPVDSVARYRAAHARFRDLPVEVVQAAAATCGREGTRPVDVARLRAAGVVLLSDDGDPIARADVLLEVLEQAAAADVVVAQHASLPELSRGVMNAGELADRLGYEGVPEVAEVALVARDIELVRASGARYHVQHLSARESMNQVRAARRDGLRVTCEVTPHHLGLEDRELASHDARFRVNPPLRSRATRMALIEALLAGAIDAVATDHAPHPPWRKDLPLELAAPGMLGLVEAFPASWTAVWEQLARRGEVSASWPDDPGALAGPAARALVRLLEALSVRPRQILGRTGDLDVGQRADLVVVDPAGRTPGGGGGVYRSANSPWQGRELLGAVRWVVRAGAVVVEEGVRVPA
jgi:dihydroorotase